MITICTPRVFVIALELGWRRNKDFDIFDDIKQFYNKFKILVTASLKDDHLDLDFNNPYDETLFRIKYYDLF